MRKQNIIYLGKGGCAPGVNVSHKTVTENNDHIIQIDAFYIVRVRVRYNDVWGFHENRPVIVL